MSLSTVLNVVKLAAAATPEEVGVVNNVLQAQKSGGTSGLLGAILGALPEEIELVTEIVAAIHAKNQPAPAAPSTGSVPMAYVIAPTKITATGQAGQAAQQLTSAALQSAAPQSNAPIVATPGEKRARDLQVVATPGEPAAS